MDETTVVRRPPFGRNPVVGERGTNTQRRILAAALDVFAEVGFHDTRVELITEAAGCSRPSFYQYFSSKDDVFWAHASQLGRAMIELADQVRPITPDAAGVQSLREWLDSFADLCDEYAPVFTAFQAAIRDHGSLATGSGSISDRLGDALIRSAGAGPELEIGSLSTSMVTMIVRCTFYRRSMGDALSRERFIDGLAHTVHRLLAGPLRDVNIKHVKAQPRTFRAHSQAESTDALETRALRPRGEKTRRKLLDAGAVVLPSRGYHDTRIDDIVEEAGVSHGSFYRYFENKDGFFRVLADRATGKMIELIDAFPTGGQASALPQWLTDWFATYRSNGGVISAWQEIEFSDPAIKELSLQAAATVLDRLVRIMEQRGFGDALVDALILLAVIERVPYSVLTLRYGDEPEAINSMAFIIRRGLMGLDGLDELMA
jgi:AcrR family transcriptional regulator